MGFGQTYASVRRNGCCNALVRFTSRLVRKDRALLTETALRRAMEDSLATGLRVIDRQGRIRASFSGEADWASPEARALIDALLAEPAS